MLAWVYLFCAILFEVAGTTAMKLSDGFTKTIPSVAMTIFYILSFTILTFAIKKLDVSIAYAVWSGLGTALITIIGIYYFKEDVTILKIVSITLIVFGVIGLHLSSRG